MSACTSGVYALPVYIYTSLNYHTQRISRYPLFISAMIDNTLPDSEERAHLKGNIIMCIKENAELLSHYTLSLSLSLSLSHTLCHYNLVRLSELHNCHIP